MLHSSTWQAKSCWGTQATTKPPYSAMQLGCIIGLAKFLNRATHDCIEQSWSSLVLWDKVALGRQFDESNDRWASKILIHCYIELQVRLPSKIDGLILIQLIIQTSVDKQHAISYFSWVSANSMLRKAAVINYQSWYDSTGWCLASPRHKLDGHANYDVIDPQQIWRKVSLQQTSVEPHPLLTNNWSTYIFQWNSDHPWWDSASLLPRTYK